MSDLNTRGRVKREASKKGFPLFIGLLAFIMLGAGTFYWSQRPAASEDPTTIFFAATLKLNRLTAKIATLNKAANALMEKSPFTFEGCLKQWERWGDTWVDVNVYRLLQNEWTP